MSKLPERKGLSLLDILQPSPPPRVECNERCARLLESRTRVVSFDTERDFAAASRLRDAKTRLRDLAGFAD